MFLSLAKLFADRRAASREQVLLLHPIQLSRWLEEAWTGARLVPELPIGSTVDRGAVPRRRPDHRRAGPAARSPRRPSYKPSGITAARARDLAGCVGARRVRRRSA